MKTTSSGTNFNQGNCRREIVVLFNPRPRPGFFPFPLPGQHSSPKPQSTPCPIPSKENVTVLHLFYSVPEEIMRGLIPMGLETTVDGRTSHLQDVRLERLPNRRNHGCCRYLTNTALISTSKEEKLETRNT